MSAPSAPSSETSAFPVAWDDPADAHRTFTIDLMHNPLPVSPLTQTTKGFAYGIAAAAAEFGLPITKPNVRYINYYQYTRDDPPDFAGTDEADAAAIESTMRREMGRLGERWRDEHLPRIEQLVREMERIESAVSAASPAEIVAMLDELAAGARELWTVHFRIVIPMLAAVQAFTEFYIDLFGGAESDAHELLVGQPSMSVQAGFGLFDLATAARQAGLKEVIIGSPLDEIDARLRETAAGRDLLRQLDDYLRIFGLRQDLFDLMTPTWRENPSIPLASVRAYLINDHDPRAEHANRQSVAGAAAAAARDRLATYPAPVRDQFEAMLRSACEGALIQEQHNFYLDQQSLAWGHLIFLQIGRRLVALDLLDAPDDVFMLKLDEIRNLLSSPVEASTRQYSRGLVAERRAGMEWADSLTPPPVLGPPPKAPPDNLVTRTNARFWGGPPQAAERPDQLKGSAGSRGVATGPAFVARSLEEAKAIEPGQILVAMTTMPAWTPFFGIAAAIVTETGGPLSHCAIVAREYGIPAVVGAHGAMRAISSGQIITVDGDNGVVTLSPPHGD